jgi:tetratricopeptide (TPR) repeat protein
LPLPLRVFISYAHEDEVLRDKFVRALSQLQRDGLIEGWDDRGIAPGAEWAGVIDERLKSAEIVVLLVSNDFLASDYCNQIELETALKRHEDRAARVVPVILRPCDWESSRFAKLQALPKDGKPVIDWKTEDHGFLNVVKGLRSIAIDLRKDRVEPKPGGAVIKRRGWPLLVGIAAALAISLAISSFFVIHPLHVQKAAQLVAWGDSLWDLQQYEQAEASYKQAEELDPKNAGAYFGLGLSADLKNDLATEIAMYGKAVSFSPRPEYKINLADAYFKAGKYEEAVKAYAAVEESPYAALESAKINRLRSLLDDSEQQCRTAIRWLNDPVIANRPENKLEWYFTTNEKLIKIITPPEKLCYAQFALSITLFLRGNDAEAQSLAEAGRKTCGDHLRHIEAELKPELKRLANERPEFTDRSRAYPAKFLDF